MNSDNRDNSSSGIIIKLYPFVILFIGLVINLLVGVSPLNATIPSIDLIQISSASAVLLLINHSWIMTSTELTRLRYKVFATPEEWRKSGENKEDISEDAQFEIERHLNAHRNTTENTIYFIFLSIIYVFISPAILLSLIWLLSYPLARLGYTYSYFSGKDALRGIFMSLSLY